MRSKAETERDREDRARDELLARGYTDLSAYHGLTVGARVRHVGEQYLNAHLHGTGIIVALMERQGSTGSSRDVELIIRRDPATTGEARDPGRWADYHAVLTDAGPARATAVSCQTYACTLAAVEHERPDDNGTLWHYDAATGVHWPTEPDAA